MGLGGGVCEEMGEVSLGGGEVLWGSRDIFCGEEIETAGDDGGGGSDAHEEASESGENYDEHEEHFSHAQNVDYTETGSLVARVDETY